jgi:ribosomal protein S18 acetylase RimI-like enzyme
MKIRTAKIDDTDAISLLNNQVQAIHAREFPHIYKPPSRDTFSSSEISDLLKKEKNIIFAAEENHQIIGYVFAEIMNYPETSIRYNMDVIFIQHISIKESYRRKGVGKLLLKRVLRLAEEKGISIIMLDVWTFNKEAANFFKKQGFSVFDERMWINI